MTEKGLIYLAVLAVMVILLFISIALCNINSHLLRIARALQVLEEPISSLQFEIRNSGHDIEKELKGVELTIDDLYEKLFTNAQVTIVKENEKWGENQNVSDIH